MFCRMRMPLHEAKVTLLAVTVACGTDAGPPPATASGNQPRADWRVDSSPMLSIGSEAKGQAYSFNRIVGLLQESVLDRSPAKRYAHCV